ncbi:DUF2207 domain-containing protein [Ruicaihuangia caeni]|uniref:DUF2207 domain-containing protein n=1 Tax=Ruicaihuangia caeni TaxID=3042517 RepID=A0AAW6T580_9MICO|nr:DUF2207 domain-containing protein [Klugiella sp. YN-L-19]MDI2097528.1 DUF2207 domain-containing protein [Klugiella sp. YN-L-19]
MRRLVIALLVAGGLLAAAGTPATAAAAAAAPVSAPASNAGNASANAVSALPADVNDFGFDRFEADYELGVDDDGRSTLRTTETLVARFPERDQNRGIRRSIPTWYDGHPTDLTVESVTDADGNDRAFELEEDDEVMHITIASNDYVHGMQTYVITYTQRNVTRYFADTASDEFYWDTNGLDWPQPFAVVTARVHLEESLVPRLTGLASCYRGAEGSNQRCDIVQSGSTFEASASGIRPYENVTIAIGFEEGTFTPRDNGYFASWAGWAQLLGTLLALAGLVWGGILWFTRTRDADGRPVIVAEYAPPRGATVLLAADVVGRSSKAVPAQLIDLAVRRKLRIIEERPEARSGRYAVELVDATGMNELELELVHAVFGATARAGQRQTLSSSDTRVGKRVQKVQSAIRKQTIKAGLRRRTSMRELIWPFVLALLGAVIAFVCMIALFDDARGAFWPLLPAAVAVLAVIGAAAAVFRAPLTSQGAEFRDHLRGMELYIKVAEADRLRTLQSPQGAERRPVDPSDREQMLHLTERMLPYAVLFGQEKRWAAELARYLDREPDWYSGSAPFSAAAFAGGIGAVTSAVSSAYTSSSTSGGSSGGGSSGGGGGGGGGGGV